ncbi:DUF58 domain-containing protein [Lentzea tibetensis]|uniref:DUF58 domain-containing protein n=1 Tax=Lentzea tibetensis TaxID=2591470 RepID=A0A563EN37_9PSEU|nr:DUF58 domain-containing protein [Lentzea tibetensis]TWP48669.1 DUF58 domain-containing protein [Lentzea tibetensis]
MSRYARISDAIAASRGAHWHATDALIRAALLGGGFVVAGALMHEVELVLMGVPLLLSLLFARKPSGEPGVTVRPLPRLAEPGSAHTAADIDPATDTELVVVRLPHETRAYPSGAGTIPIEVRRDAWGPGVDLRVDHLFAGPDALHVYGPVVGVEHSRTVLPPLQYLPAGPLPPRAAGLVGAHRSPRPGDSTELRDIRAFQPGDRLRRIDWRISLRTGNLHVRERHAEADAEVVLAVDTRSDVAQDVAGWAAVEYGTTTRTGGSLDRAVRTAASLAASYLRQGDRVALVDLGRPQLNVRSGVGRRHLLRLRNQLVVCARAAGWAQRPYLPHISYGAVVVVLSPFLDNAVAEIAVHAARRGHLVLAVDSLPSPLLPDAEEPWGVAATALIAAEQRARLALMARHGVVVTTC